MDTIVLFFSTVIVVDLILDLVYYVGEWRKNRALFKGLWEREVSHGKRS